jgi:hypothetical protein
MDGRLSVCNGLSLSDRTQRRGFSCDSSFVAQNEQRIHTATAHTNVTIVHVRQGGLKLINSNG